MPVSKTVIIRYTGWDILAIVDSLPQVSQNEADNVADAEETGEKTCKRIPCFFGLYFVPPEWVKQMLLGDKRS